MSQTPFELPAKPTEITLDTLPQLFAHHRARFGGIRMSITPPEPTPPSPDTPPTAPQRPEGVSEEEWNALGDPGKAAIVREREARVKAERERDAARARPTPPKNQPTPTPPAPTPPAPAPQPPAPANQPGDIATIVQQAVAAAIKPFQDAETQRQAEAAAGKVTDAVLTAAKDRFVDPADALAGIDLTTITDGNGGADPAKITTALDDLLKRKPYLGLGPRTAQPGFGAQPPAPANTDEQVKAILARMQTSAGIRPSTTR